MSLGVISIFPIKSMHDGTRDQVCNLCGKAFIHPWTLKLHISSIHEGIKNHKCKICDKSFALKAKMKRHMKTVHRGAE